MCARGGTGVTVSSPVRDETETSRTENSFRFHLYSPFRAQVVCQVWNVDICAICGFVGGHKNDQGV